MNQAATIDSGPTGFDAQGYGVVTEAGTIRFERLLPGPIDRVWDYLTDSEKRGRWLATGPLEQRAGGTVELRFRHADLSPIVEETPERYKEMEGGMTMTGQVIRCDPPRLLSFSWGGLPAKGSEVTFELEPRGDNVLLTLTHRRLTAGAEMLSVSGGWHAHLAILADNLNGVTPRPFWSTHATLEAAYRQRL